MARDSSEMLHTMQSGVFIPRENLFKAELVPGTAVRMVWRVERSFSKG